LLFPSPHAYYRLLLININWQIPEEAAKVFKVPSDFQPDFGDYCDYYTIVLSTTDFWEENISMDLPLA